MTEDKENTQPPPRKVSGKGARGRGVMMGAGRGRKASDGDAVRVRARPRKLSAIKPRISIDELRNAYRRQASLPHDIVMPVFDPMAKAQESKKITRGRTGLVYDERMAEHQCLWDENYPECPGRFSTTLNRFRELGLVDRCLAVLSRAATEEELLKLHTRSHLCLLWRTKDEQDPEILERLSASFDSIYLHPKTYELALLAAGSTIDLVDAVVSGTVQNGMALIRPPGHHAMTSEFCGYCYINNVAVAAREALDKHKLSRILIVDWDVHHGQATQQMFYEDPRVLYFSIHRYEHGTFWPELRESEYDHVGAGAGRGFNFNVPLNKIGMTNADYLAIFHQVLLPVAYEYNPELIIVSSGYDAALGCPEGEMKLTPSFYGHMVSSLMTLAGGKVAVVFEGGYCLQSLAEGASVTLSTLLGDPCPRLQDPLTQPSDSLKESLLNLIYVHRPYWKCFQYQGSFSTHDITPPDGSRYTPSITYQGTGVKPLKYDTRNCYPTQSQEDKEQCNKALARLMLDNPPKIYGKDRLCLVYDEQMSLHQTLAEKEHPERPERTARIWKYLEQYNIMERALVLKSRKATREELELVHTPEHVNFLSSTSGLEKAALVALQDKYKSIYFHPKSNESALLSAGSLLEVVDSVCSDRSVSGIGVIRPPGHHAEMDQPHGFCFYNNVAIAARYAIERHNCQRVLILDWDVHHGNGIQHAFEGNPQVLYISIHRYDHGLFFPSSEDANYDKVGTGKGEGYTVNIAWNKSGMGDAEYIAAMSQVVLPIAYQFEPQLVLVSAGFDAAIGDPLGGCRVTPECYGHMTQLMSSLAGGRVILALEGGYNLSAISYCMVMCAKALLGDPMPPLQPALVPNKNAVQSIMDTLSVHKKYWSALAFQVDLPVEDVLCQGFGGGAQPVESGVSASCSSSSGSPSSSDASPTYVSAPSSPTKSPSEPMKALAASVAKMEMEDNGKTDVEEKMELEETPKDEAEKSVRSRVKSQAAASASTIDNPNVSAVAEMEKQKLASQSEKVERTARRPARNHANPDDSLTPTRPRRPLRNVGILLRAAASSVGLVKDISAVSCLLNYCTGVKAILDSLEQHKNLDTFKKLEPEDSLKEKISSVFNKIRPERTEESTECSIGSCTGSFDLSCAITCAALIKELMAGSVLNGLALIPANDLGNKGSSNSETLAVGAHFALNNLGLQRVLLIDCNAQSSSQSLQDDPRVLMFSMSHNGSEKEHRSSRCFSFNLPETIMQGDYLCLLHQIILPMAYEFCPELVIISFGNDVVQDSQEVLPPIYAHMVALLMPLAQERLAVIYQVDKKEETKSIAAAIMSSLQDQASVPVPENDERTTETQEAVLRVVSEQQSSWKSMQHHAQASLVNSNKPVPFSTALDQRVMDGKDITNKLRGLENPQHTLCLVYDEAMMEHFSYEDETHPERPERISCIFQRLQEFGIVSRCKRVKSGKACPRELEALHTSKHLRFMSNLHTKKPQELQTLQRNYESVYFHRQTNSAALLAAGSLLAVVDSVLTGESRRGVAVIRPPGHHAERNEACGFCFYNNVAVAAKHAIDTYGLTRVLILDWDVHHGNGIQHMFEADPQVLYISIHRYDNGKFFPGSPNANYNRTGVKNGRGYNINIPWNQGGMGDAEYIAAMTQVVVPVAVQYDPQLVLVSAGFDAAVGDPLGGCKVSPECYGHMTKLLSSLAGGRVVVALEGGYNLTTISYCMTMCAKALLGDPLIPLSQGLVPCPSACQTLTNVVTTHRKFWSALDLKRKITPKKSSPVKKTSTAGTDGVDNASGMDSLVACLGQMDIGKDEEPEECVEASEAAGGMEGACGVEATGINTFLLTEATTDVEAMYAVVPLQWCPHLETVQPLPDAGLDVHTPCQECGDVSENWVCLVCYKVLCGRFVNEHMLLHGVMEQHFMVLSFADLSVWCYACDAYVHNEILNEAKRAAHISKFGEDIPGST